MTVRQLVMFQYTAHGPEQGRGLAALDGRGRVMLADAAANPGTSITNAMENAIWPARELLGVGPDAEVYLYAADDPVQPRSVWRVTFDVRGATYSEVPHLDSELTDLSKALARARGEQ
jgi:hypothetical protein